MSVAVPLETVHGEKRVDKMVKAGNAGDGTETVTESSMSSNRKECLGAVLTREESHT